MKRSISPGFAALLLLAASAPLSAGRSDDALALVPADAATVALVRISDLRTSPLAARVFADMDRLSVDGDAARFLDETRLNLKEDVDLIVAAGSPRDTGKSSGLVLFEGRFDPARLSAALTTRGAERKTSVDGEYFLLKDPKRADAPSQGAVAFVSAHLVIAGDEASVTRALASRGSGGSGFASGTGLGRHLSRIDSGASAWALVDVTRVPMKNKAAHSLHAEGDVNGRHVNVQGSGDSPSAAIMSAMKSVSLVALQATAKGDGLKLAATGLSDDEETRELLEDAIRGALAGWRLSLQDKSPDAVAVIRKFKVSRDRDGVSISGTLPGAAIRALTERKHGTD